MFSCFAAVKEEKGSLNKILTRMLSDSIVLLRVLFRASSEIPKDQNAIDIFWCYESTDTVFYYNKSKIIQIFLNKHSILNKLNLFTKIEL